MDQFKRFISFFVLTPITFYIIFLGNFIFKIFLILCLVISIYEWFKFRLNNLILVIGFLYINISFYLIYLFRYVDENSSLIFLLVTLICVATDTGGYIFGKIFKGPKITKISPNKTYSGLFGAILLSLILTYFYTSLLKINGFIIELINIPLIIFISLVSQLGDLIVSFFKRKSDIKDTGNLIPGHGGLLDRIDGMIFAFPFSYLYFYS